MKRMSGYLYGWRKEVRIKQMKPFHETYSTPIDDVEECDDCVSSFGTTSSKKILERKHEMPEIHDMRSMLKANN